MMAPQEVARVRLVVLGREKGGMEVKNQNSSSPRVQLGMLETMCFLTG